MTGLQRALNAFTLALIAVLVLHPQDAKSAEGGYGNYIPGTYGDFAMAVAPAASLTLRNDVYFYNAEIDRSVRSGQVEADADLEFLADFITLIYNPQVELLGGQYMFGVFVPIMNVEIESRLGGGGMSARNKDDATGLGDIAWIPLAYFGNRGNVYYSFTQMIISPTGEYDVDEPVNVGLNYWSFDSNIAMTYLNAESGQDYSFNFGYMYNTENEDTDYQSGQNLHLDVVLNHFLSETTAAGVHGFALRQITDDSGSGALLGDFESEAVGAGLNIMHAIRIGEQDVTLIGKWTHEFDAENRIEGDHFFASFAMDW